MLHLIVRLNIGAMYSSDIFSELGKGTYENESSYLEQLTISSFFNCCGGCFDPLQRGDLFIRPIRQKNVFALARIYYAKYQLDFKMWSFYTHIYSTSSGPNFLKKSHIVRLQLLVQLGLVYSLVNYHPCKWFALFDLVRLIFTPLFQFSTTIYIKSLNFAHLAKEKKT